MEVKNEGYTKDRKHARFLGQITNLEYDVSKQKLGGDMTKDFDDCSTWIKTEEQEFLTEDTDGMKK